MKTIIFLVLAIVFFVSTTIHAQDAEATINTVTECPGNEVIISLDVENFINVGAMSLYIGYDTTKLHFETITNIHPVFAGTLYNAMVLPQPQIGISFASVNGVTLLSGKLFDMKFTYLDGVAPLVFNPGCELATPGFDFIPVIYNDGGVNPLILITEQPADTTVTQPAPASFMVGVSGGNSFQWQRSTNGGATWSNLSNNQVYQGVNTPELQILSTNPFVSGSLYKCRVTAGDCVVFSDSALLTVIPPVVQTIQLAQGWSSLSSYINPTNPDPDILFAGIMPSLEIVISGDNMYYPSGGINTIGDFDPKKGYAIKLNNSETLTISGSVLQDNHLTIPAGWSFLPVIVDCNTEIETLFIDHLAEIDIIQELAGINTYWPEMDIFTLLTLTPGKSYLVKMKSEVVVVFPECRY